MEKTLEVMAAAIKRADGKYLIAKRAREKAFGGMWEFPGGQLERGETHQQCLLREIETEEFPGMRIEIGKFFGIGSYKNIMLYGYHARHVSGEAKSVEHEETMWVYPSEFGSYEFAPADVPLYKILQQI